MNCVEVVETSWLAEALCGLEEGCAETVNDCSC
jgi:hypothetical protein